MPLKMSRVCRECGRRTLHEKEHFSFGWGCLLSLLTVGLFLPVWLLIGIFEAFKPYRCVNCGRGRLL